MKVSVIIPCYNEEKRISKTIEASIEFLKKNNKYEFIFVDDGSTDNTKKILEKESKIKTISYEKNRGKGHAVGVGVAYADGDYICFLDSDLAYSLDHLPLMVNELKNSDIVIGCRGMVPSNQENIKITRRIFGMGFNFLSRIILGLKNSDMQAGLKGFKREVAKDLFWRKKMDGWSFDTEIIYLAKKRNYTIKEIPARVSKESYNLSKINLFKDSLIMFLNLFKIRLNGFSETKQEKKILLSFDLEEFDIPEEYGQKISDGVKIKVSLRGLKKVIELLDRLDIRVTFFVTANFAKHNRKLIKELAEKHEIASHGFCHSSFSLGDLRESKKALEKIAGQEIRGLRIPKLAECEEKEIVGAGYSYNSSMNPTFIPGKYNNFFKKRKAYYSNNLFNIPISVMPIIRFPLFWLSFKNLPLRVYKFLSGITLSSDKYLNIYFHPWEFTDISYFNLPNYIKKDSGEKMLRKLEKYLIWLKSKGEFITFSDFQEDCS